MANHALAISNCALRWSPRRAGMRAEFLPAEDGLLATMVSLFLNNGIVARMGRDCPAGSSRDDQSPVPALPGCAIALPASDPAIECVMRRGHLSCRFQHYRACEMRDNACVAHQIVEFSRI